MGRPREFWIDEIKHDELNFISESEMDNCLHVIEYPAYQKLETKLAELVVALEYPDLDCGDNSCRFVDRSKLTGMRTNGGCRCIEQQRNTFIKKALEARETLAKFRGESK